MTTLPHKPYSVKVSTIGNQKIPKISRRSDSKLFFELTFAFDWFNNFLMPSLLEKYVNVVYGWSNTTK